jgi:hypothetical protein
MIYAKLKYSSLFDYCVKNLGYSEATAYRRINCLKLIKEMPEISKKLKTGKVTVSSLSTLQSFIKHEKKHNNKIYSDQKKQELLFKIENKTKKQTEKVLTEISPKFTKQDKERIITPTETEIRFNINEKTKKKLEKIKELISHKNPNPSYEELFDYMADIVIDKIDPEKKAKRSLGRQNKQKTANTKSADNCCTSSSQRKLQADMMTDNCCTSSSQRKLQTKKPSRYIPAYVKNHIIKHLGWKCSYVNPTTGERCNSKHSLEFEHKIPFAMGGKNSIANVTLLCKTHNQLAAVKAYGKAKMEKFLN